MTFRRMTKASMAGLFRYSRQKVSVPILACVLVFIVILMIDIEVRKFSSLVEQSSEPALVADDVNPSADSAHADIMARIEEVLADEPEVSQRRGAPSGKSDNKPEVVESPKQPSLSDVHMEEVEVSEGEVDALAQILRMRISQASEGVIGTRHCSILNAMNNTRGTCIDTTCPYNFSPSAKTRIRQLLHPRLRQTPQQLAMIDALAKDVVPKKYIFVTAASSNHYYESQALMFNLRKFIFSKLHPDSYSFLYFDLGLKPLERQRVEKNCNCTVLNINLKNFPKHTRHLMCYAWKPFIIKALLPKSQVLIYMDSSVRFKNMDLDAFFAAVRQWGAQFLASMDSIPNHTVQSTFDFYQEPACLFWPFPELLAGFSVFHNEPFMTRVVVDPWVACAFNQTCMCPVDPHAFRICSHTERRVGGCHRFDLSSLTVQMAKLYGNKFGHLVLQDKTRPVIRRDDRMAYFTD